MRVLAYYLPQFHVIEENNKWWGENYTEWTAVKDAIPLYKGHIQPKQPLEGYYNLLNRKTMEHQAELLNKYNIDGLCIYHYYFADGKKILEKPAENLLRWTDLPINYCFSWASESWVRSWSKLQGNSWNTKIDLKQKKDDHYLIKQEYGDKGYWKRHFEYLLPFFKDSRYIKEEGKPVFVIYHPDWIGCIREMGEYWNELAIASGFPGIYLIGDNASENKIFESSAIHEPQDTLIDYFFQDIQEKCPIHAIYDYDDVWNYMLSNPKLHRGMCLCGFVQYDDTPRRATNGFVIEGATPEKFEKYMTILLDKGRQLESPFVFLNAWNEWGEGMYLEPDVQSRFGYLEAYRNAKSVDSERRYVANIDVLEDISRKTFSNSKRYERYFRLFDKWLTIKESHIDIGGYLYSHGIHSIGIYGLGMMGRHLIAELSDSEVDIKYGVDKKAAINNQIFSIFKTCDKIPEADAVIITVVYNYESIIKELKNHTKAEVILLSELINQISDSCS